MKKAVLFLIMVIFLSSCRNQHINYLKNIQEVALKTSAENMKSTIQTGDQLAILVTAKDMDVTKPFNQNYSSGEVSQYTLSSGNLQTRAADAVSGPTYIVDTCYRENKYQGKNYRKSESRTSGKTCPVH